MNSNYKVNIKDIQDKYTFKIFCAGADTTEIEQEIEALDTRVDTLETNITNKEDKSNKVTALSNTSTDTQYPSAKCVYDSQIEQDETISTLETNLEETQAELDRYKTIYNVLPKVNGNGESITLDNTGESILKLDTRGQCKQDGEPTPDAPQQIHEVSGDNTIEVVGKNILNKEDIITTNTGNWGVTQTTNGIIIEHKSQYSTGQPKLVFNLKPNTQYTLSAIISSYGSIAITPDGGSTTYMTTQTSVSKTTGSEGTITLLFNATQGQSATIDYMQLEEGTSSSTYEPYQIQTYELSLGDIKMRGIGTYEDYFVRNSEGQWCKYNAIEEVTLASSQFNEKGTTGTNAYYISTTIANGLNDNSVASSMSNKFGMVAFNNRQNGLDVTYFQNGRLYIRTKNNTSLDWSTNQNCKDWLDANSPIIDYILASPYLSPISNETLISQLDKIEKALGKEGQTNISQVNNDAPFKIYASALKDMSNDA